jgi:hypothetical protein
LAVTEVCFCGWSGDFEDKELVLVAEGLCGLRCPRCGRIDALDALPPTARTAMIQAAIERQRAASTAA